MKLALSLALVFVPTPAQARDAVSGPAVRRCDIALAYVSELLREPSLRHAIFSTQPVVPFIPDGYPTQWISMDGLSPAPPAPSGLAEALPRATNAVRSCASIRRLLTRRHIRFGRRSVAWARHLQRGYFRARIIMVSLPAVSPDGAHAVLVESNSRGGLDAGESWVHMERDRDGRWRAAGISALWVS